MKPMKRAVVCLLALFLAGCGAARPLTVQAAAANPGAPEVYNSGNASELITTLPVTKPPAAAAVRSVFCIDLGDPPLGGEVLDVTGSFEATNDLGYTVALEWHLMFTTSCDATDGGDISENTGTNITAATHHMDAEEAGVISVEDGNSRRYVVMLVQSASTAATAGAKLTINKEHGRLTVMRWRLAVPTAPASPTDSASPPQ